MRFQTINLVAALLGAAAAVPCYQLTMGGNGDTPILEGIDPFGDQPAGQHWDIVPANDCYIRWQVIRPGQAPNDARVTKTVLDSTPESVRRTMNSYFNEAGTNDQLFFPLRTRSLQYSYMVPGNLGDDHPPVDPQSSLSDTSRIIVSIILPSGKDKVTRVAAERKGDAKEDEAVDRAEGVGIVGLKGTIATSDWAYTTGTELRLAMRSLLKEQQDAYYGGRRWKKQKFAYTLVEKANGDCVVIDFRDFEQFVLAVRPAAVD